MDLTERERHDLAARLATERLRRYGGSRKAAYTAAGVNSNTWTRAEKGQSIAERSLVAILLTLWPETGGDHRLMEPPLATRHVPDVQTAIKEMGLSPAQESRVADLIEQVRREGRKRA